MQPSLVWLKPETLRVSLLAPSKSLQNSVVHKEETRPTSVTGLDIEVNYVDFRDASGETTEVGDSAGVKGPHWLCLS